jgi:predicted ATPase
MFHLGGIMNNKNENKKNYELLTIEVKDFGVIKGGEVKLKPLTIFFGKNNTGKTYMGHLIWGIFAERLRGRWNLDGNNVALKLENVISDQNCDSIMFNELNASINSNYLKRIFNYNDFNNSNISINKKINYNIIFKYLDISGTNEDIQFSNIDDATPTTKKTNEFYVTVLKDMYRIKYITPTIKGDIIAIRENNDSAIISKYMASDIYDKLLKTVIGNSIYLPASKSGLILSSGLFIDMLVKSFKSYEIDSMPNSEQIVFTEPVKHFMKNYLTPNIYTSNINEEYQNIVSLIEDNILKGTLTYDATVNKSKYITKTGKNVPFHCASSSVVETIPLLKLIKFSNTVGKGTLLIIEEPEAHLHPDAQRIFARAVVNLINKGVYVLLITHSPDILQQVNNNMKLYYLKENMDKGDFKKLLVNYGFNDFDVLNPEMVSPYLFVDEDNNGTVIKELDINEEIGISNRAFHSVMMDLYQETACLKQEIEYVKSLGGGHEKPE